MPKRKSPFPEKYWKPDPAKWQRHLEKQPSGKTEPGKIPDAPARGWMLYRLDTLEDVKQT